MLNFVNPPTVHAPAASYSHHATVTNCTLLFTSGQIGMRPDGSIPEGHAPQLETAFANIRANLDAGGMSMHDVVKITIYLVGNMETDVRREIIARELGDARPTMSVFYVAGLGTPEMCVEIEAIAAKPLA